MIIVVAQMEDYVHSGVTTKTKPTMMGFVHGILKKKNKKKNNSNMKKFFKDLWNNGLAYDMKVIAVLFAIAIVIVVIVCGINGNNDQNFWKKDIHPVYQIDTNVTQISQACQY